LYHTQQCRDFSPNRVSLIESVIQYQIVKYLNQIMQCLKHIVDAIQIAIKSNRGLILPITGVQWVASAIALTSVCCLLPVVEWRCANF